MLAQFARFGLVGVANTLVGSGLILLLAWQGVDPYLANILGYVTGTLLSFALNARWTFGSRMSADHLARFLLVIVAAYVINLLVLALTLGLGWGALASQLPAMVCFTVANFLGQRYFTFREQEQTA
ncbi:hypothetical protein UC35_19440 [Ramlibacter tataouinensis]|uniref:GtrA/DPMS transmembrane domain-containing protein n=1 Tax=Ramlibacter tataouinensis TaxID=94132 RepID=A0A127JX78_9BURK|nr:hypothetical protein UC35_19440 [Ramlibacter tataouinensis]